MSARAELTKQKLFEATLRLSKSRGLAGMKAARQAQYEEPWLSG